MELFSRPIGRLLAASLAAAGWLAWGQTAGPPAPPPEQGQVIDRIVAVVEGVEDARVITRSDLELEAAVSLVQRGGTQAATASFDDRQLAKTLDYAIAQRLLIAEADKVTAHQIDEGELDATLRAFEARFESPAAFQRFLQRHDVDRAAVRQVLRRSLRADRVLESRVRLRAQVSEIEVRRYYDQHQEELSASYDEVRHAIRERLLREKYASLVRDEVEQLRQGTTVRVLAPLPPAGEEDGQGGGEGAAPP